MSWPGGRWVGAARPGGWAARSALAVAGAVVASALVGCAGEGSHARTGATGAATGAGAVAWGSCPGGESGWQCGTLAVPLDHAHPGRAITLALTRHRATDRARRIGALVVNPGGPGVSGIAWAFSAVADLFDPVLVKDFDIVAFDPRGVGASTPVTCVDGPTLDRINHLDPVLDSAARLAAVTAADREEAAACEARSGWLLPDLSTQAEAEDLDTIRAALGEPKLTYLGFSYGTLLGARYAELYPTHVRALALDGAVDPAVGPLAVDLAQATGFERELTDFLADCSAGGDSCPFQRRGAPTLRAAFDTLVAGIRTRPLPGRGPRTVGPAEALYGILWPLYQRARWPELANALAAAQEGDGSLLLAEFDAYVGRRSDGTYDNSEVAEAAIGCLDHPRPTLAEAQAAEPAIATASPYFGPPVALQDLICDVWPVPPVSATAPIDAAGAPPILVVGSTGDPATPYQWARSLAAELTSGVLLTRHGDGHTAYAASACAAKRSTATSRR